ncbi:MAG: tripartite tricarboxylate transporter substrate binding protein [Rhodospirillaceae bacterium]|nr:tripartite tricarboxylate transporter substrate binding protein [Rhodospirillaceae bacterium]MCA8932291.1 tripartite tricarboxylate transporter substrate binding protein [Rhodospirillaceae bacterium]
MLASTIRNGLIGGLVGLALASGAAVAQDFVPENPECIAPANPGGGWDFTCRQVGRTLQDLGLISSTMQVVNMAGGSGGTAFAHVVNERNDDNDLIIAASSATATRLAQGAFPGNTMDQVRWLASVGADYGVIAVAVDSPIQTLPEFFEQMASAPETIAIGGGSAVGGWDHLKVLIAAQAFGIDDVRAVRYVAFEGGGEAVTQLLAGSLQGFSGDLSEVRGFIESGDVRVLAVLAPERLGGDFADLPTAREQGIDAIGANWRGFYAPGDMSDEAYDAWVAMIADLYASDEWQEVMVTNGLAPLDLQGADFEAFVANSIAQIEALSREIGIIQ